MGFESSEAGLPPGAAEALADPIVQALMAADHVDPNRLEALLQRVAIRLAAGRGDLGCGRGQPPS